ncbi:hypothetical protein J2X71_004134 [Rhizobium sp. 1399]|nr:hypothetical protein [Rhizobium sp. 1399]
MLDALSKLVDNSVCAWPSHCPVFIILNLSTPQEGGYVLYLFLIQT